MLLGTEPRSSTRAVNQWAVHPAPGYFCLLVLKKATITHFPASVFLCLWTREERRSKKATKLPYLYVAFCLFVCLALKHNCPSVYLQVSHPMIQQSGERWYFLRCLCSSHTILFDFPWAVWITTVHIIFKLSERLQVMWIQFEVRKGIHVGAMQTHQQFI